MSLTMLQVVLPSNAEGSFIIYHISFMAFIFLLFQQIKGCIHDTLLQFYLHSNSGRFLGIKHWLYQQPRVSYHQG